MTAGVGGSVGPPARLPLEGYRVGVTAARKADQQVELLERRGAETTWAPVLSTAPYRVDQDALRAQTEHVLTRPVDLFLATTGIGLRTWFEAAASWGLRDPLLAALAPAEVLARGPKSVGALRRAGLHEAWSAPSEELGDVLAHLDGRDLTGLHVVVQEHGQSLSTVADDLRRRGARVTSVVVYRVVTAEDDGPTRRLVREVVDGRVDALTFTSAPAVAAFLEAAETLDLDTEVVRALRGDVLVCCVGPVTAAAFDVWEVPTVHPDRSRLAAMVKQLEVELPRRHPDGPGGGPAGLPSARGRR